MPSLAMPVDVWRLITHQSVRIATQIRLPDVVAPDDEDVGLLRVRHMFAS